MTKRVSSYIGKKNAPCVFILLAVIGFVAWGGGIGAGFTRADEAAIVGNQKIRTLTPLSKFLEPVAVPGDVSERRAIWRPLTTFSYALSYSAFGLSSTAFRSFNLAGHVLNSFMFFLVALGLFGAGRRGVKRSAFAAALLFLVHPAQYGTVSVVSQRSNILFLFFYLSSYLAYIKAFRCPYKAEREAYTRTCPTERAWYLYGFSAALFIFSLLAREMAVSLPVLIFLTAYIFEKSGLRLSVLKALPYAVIALLYIWARGAVLGEAAWMDHGACFLPRALALARDFAQYLGIMIMPYPNGWQSLLQAKMTQWLEVAVYAGLLGGILLQAWRLRKGRPILSLGIFFFFAALLPAFNVAPVSGMVNEQFLYLSLTGFSMAVADTLAHALESEPLIAKVRFGLW